MPKQNVSTVSAFVLTGFTGAFLLFAVQPVIAARLLPWYGGAPAVWTTCMLFFQTVLLAGYAYAHFLCRLEFSRQFRIHATLALLCTGLLLTRGTRWPAPIVPGDGWRPDPATAPIPGILLTLCVSVGGPFLLLAASSSILQTWYLHTDRVKTPWWLYAVSNAGSLAAIAAYPVLIEPFFDIFRQGAYWSLVFGAYAVGILVCGKATGARGGASVARPPDVSDAPGPPREKYIVWTILAAVASAMLISVTNKITQEIATFPLLWLVPLAIYLISFILTFTPRRLYFRGISLGALTVLLVTAFIASEVHPPGIIAQTALFLAVLLFTCLVCHGEVYRSRPAPARLTSFYLTIAFGGAVGGLFASVLAPLLFDDFWEFPVTLMASLAIVAGLVEQLTGERRSERFKRVAKICVVTVAVALIVTGWFFMLGGRKGLLDCRRNFFGVLRIRETNWPKIGDTAYVLINGSVNHGFQFRSREREGMPTAYFAYESGIGLLLQSYREKYASRIARTGIRIGVVGLGIGTIAAYAREGDTIRFYEINPAVVEIAESDRFTFLRNCPAEREIVHGDARLSMEKEIAHGLAPYDIIAIDAFTDDAIPVHLLTVEAMDVYLRLLKDDAGAIAFHVSNTHLNLVPVVKQLAEKNALAGLTISTPADGMGTLNCVWVVVARDPELLAGISGVRAEIIRLEDAGDIRPWTDGFSNLLGVLRIFERN